MRDPHGVVVPTGGRIGRGQCVQGADVQLPSRVDGTFSQADGFVGVPQGRVPGGGADPRQAGQRGRVVGAEGQGFAELRKTFSLG